jgi:hypothetical protein
MPRFDVSNETHTTIVGSYYMLSLEGRDPAGVDAAAMLDVLCEAVPAASERQIIEALRREGERLIRESDILARFLKVRAQGGAR